MSIEWIAERRAIEVDPNAYRVLQDFLVLWLYLEGTLSRRNLIRRDASLGAEVFEVILARLNRRGDLVGTPLVTSAFDGFVGRYRGGELERLFQGLDPRQRADRERGQRMYEIIQRGDGVSYFDKALCVSYVCSRVRNNLFHGVKELADIEAQGALFDASCAGLKGLLVASGCLRG